MKEIDARFITTLMDKTSKIAYMDTLVDVLHRMVDAEEIESKGRGLYCSISTNRIRELFGWSMCNAAKNAAIEYEAEKKRKEQEDGDSDV